MLKKQLIPPYIPPLKSVSDTSNFPTYPDS